MRDNKRVYTFGNGLAEGAADMRNLLGGKGANLAEMNRIGVPVPPGFTITTETCNEYFARGKDTLISLLSDEVMRAVHHIEGLMGATFGDPTNPLLVSVRSGARASMPGMMDTILNLGLNDTVVEGLAKKTGNPRFAYDSYRRFVQMYGDVVLGMKPETKEDIAPFEEIIDRVKAQRGVRLDNELNVDELKSLVILFKQEIKRRTGKDFPTDPMEQLWGAICAVFDSWMNERAILYRKMEGIPAEWGTAVNVQAMVFGNMGDTSATGVCFSRNAGTGENVFNGEYLVNAQGEDVVAGIRTPQPSSICFSSASKPTTRTCRTWSSPYRTASCGSCRPVMGSAPVLRWSRSLWTSFATESLMRRLLSYAVSLTSSMSSSTPYLIPSPRAKLRSSRTDFPLRPVQLRVRSYSSLTTRLAGMTMVAV